MQLVSLKATHTVTLSDIPATCYLCLQTCNISVFFSKPQILNSQLVNLSNSRIIGQIRAKQDLPFPLLSLAQGSLYDGNGKPVEMYGEKIYNDYIKSTIYFLRSHITGIIHRHSVWFIFVG